MQCPECKKSRTESAGDPIRTGGDTLYPRRCLDCGYFWSHKRASGVVVDAPPPIHGVPAGAPMVEILTPPAVEAGIPEAARNVDPVTAPALSHVEPLTPKQVDALKVGEVIEFERKGGLARGAVASNRPGARTLQVDADGRPDLRVKKSKITGRVVQD